MRLRQTAIVAVAVLLAACTGADDGSSGAAAAPAAARADVAQSTAVVPGGGVQDGITVTGTGRVSGRPDTLTATIGVEVIADSVAAALSGANEQADALFSALTDAGVASEDIQTVDVSLQPRFPEPVGGVEPGGGPSGIEGYTATNLVRVVLRDLDSAGEVLQQAAAAAGDAARIQNVGFELQDNAALLEQARAAAFEEARAKAEQYAELADASLGGIVGLTEGVATPPAARSFAGGDAAAESAAVPIAPGEQEVRVTVTATWALQ